jgi:hypothetical protein
MPWATGDEFADRHNHKLMGPAATKAAHMATAMVSSGVPEGEAIATANKHGNGMMHDQRALGGGLKSESFHLGSPGTMKLPTDPGFGKTTSPSQGSPWWTRSEARSGTHAGFQYGGDIGMGMGLSSAAGEQRYPDQQFDSGLIGGGGFGRTDRLPLSVAAGSHVLPADVVSGLGQGNTLAGAKVLEASLATGPWGMRIPHEDRGHGPPRAPTVPSFLQPQAGGGDPHSTSILAAAGEIVVPSRDVVALGERAIAQGLGKKGQSAADVGHDLLDRMIHNVRQFNIAWLQKAPPPKRSMGGAVFGAAV